MGSQIVMSGIQAMQAHKIKEAVARGRLKQGLTVTLLLVAALAWQGSLRAAEAGKTMPQLEDVTFSTLPGNRVQVELVMSAPVNVPRSFTTDTPARSALDFPDTTSNLAKKSQVIGSGSVRGVTAVQGDSRLRVVVDLVKMTPYQTRVDGKHFYITVDSADSGVLTASAEPQGAVPTTATTKAPYQINAVDFRRGERGEGRVTIALANAATPVNVREEGGKLMVDFAGTNLPKDLQRRLDVVDFATPVTTIDAFTVGHDVRLVISATGNYEHLAYQTDRQFPVEVKPVTKAAQEGRGRLYRRKVVAQLPGHRGARGVADHRRFHRAQHRGERCGERLHQPAPQRCALGSGPRFDPQDQEPRHAQDGQRDADRPERRHRRARKGRARVAEADRRAGAAAIADHHRQLRQGHRNREHHPFQGQFLDVGARQNLSGRAHHFLSDFVYRRAFV